MPPMAAPFISARLAEMQPEQEERLLNACQTIVAIASVMQSFEM